ncbi:MAG: glycine cleavage system aminomethyltransferase GcvT [Desulfatitalea sp.]|nr:glycine cleavage system aminomethyltransferase GcvT [Desulfatitalea sp.]NNK01057.1 glycine cleavage system aminomethyltransferase GcvT [Desulfatitalea sp.]
MSLRHTPLFNRHVALNAQMVPFGGWEMPVQYPGGILQEHLATRHTAGLFDISHMGRFVIQGASALPFLQHVLTNNASALALGESHYTMLPDRDGHAIDDAYLYRFVEDQYLLVVNAANRAKDWHHLQNVSSRFQSLHLLDRTNTLAMLSLQGPQSKSVLSGLLNDGALPEPRRNALSIARMAGTDLWISRTGYTGEPLCVEIFVAHRHSGSLWDALIAEGAHPVGLGARDTLRLEAGMPLYGHELGSDPQNRPIPIFSVPLARFAVSFSPCKGDFIGRPPLLRQFTALNQLINGDETGHHVLPYTVRPFELIDKGIARTGAPLFRDDAPAGWVTSGTMVPFWQFQGKGLVSGPDGRNDKRAIGLALMDSRISPGDTIMIDVRGKPLQAGVMPFLLRSDAPPRARPFTWSTFQQTLTVKAAEALATPANAKTWVERAIQNHQWRNSHCINLIPSEQSPSPIVRLLSITDPMGRYAEHKKVKAFADADIFYYQGTDFIAAVETALTDQLRLFLGCRQAEIRPISGQMANMVLFGAMLDHLNRADRKSEQRRMRMVMNHHIIRGGHLSAQPMGALRDFVRRDPALDRPAVINVPVQPDNPFQVDIEATHKLMALHRPELIILGRSMTLHKEPVAAMRRMIDDLDLDTVLLYDMAHVLGLCGPHFQQPFMEGADVVTGSTHKTFFGSQRGIVAADMDPHDTVRYPLWEAVQRRAFPGAVSNHHLGSLLGLLLAAMEMNAFKDDYQPRVLANAKVFARALADVGLTVAGDPGIGYTETHQVIVRVGYAQGPAIARRLEENNIICNYQAAPEEEGFTAAGALRLGTAEMTRFGMQAEAFQATAQLMADVILRGKTVKEEVKKLRRAFLDHHFCFSDKAMDDVMERLHQLFH